MTLAPKRRSIRLWIQRLPQALRKKLEMNTSSAVTSLLTETEYPSPLQSSVFQKLRNVLFPKSVTFSARRSVLMRALASS